MVWSLHTESRLLRKEVGNLKKDKTTLTNNFQSAEILLNMIQTGMKILEKKVVRMKENTNTLNNKTQSNEVLLEVVQTDYKPFQNRDCTFKGG